MINEIEDIIKSCEKYNGPAKCEIVVIGKEQAERLLKLNYDFNRDEKKKYIEKYKKDMEMPGEFLLSPDDIAVDDQGCLINGQHRLWAVVKSGIPQPFVILYNLPPKTKDIINNGNPTTSKDRAKMNLSEIGMNINRHAWGMMCQCLAFASNGKKKQDFTTDIKEVRKFANNNKEMLRQILNRDYGKAYKKNKPSNTSKKNKKNEKEHFGIKNVPTTMAIEFELRRRNAEYAKEFFDDINSINEIVGSPIKVLREWMLNMSIEHRASNGTAAGEIAMMIAYDGYVKWKKGQKNPLTEIEVMRPVTDTKGNPILDATGKPVTKFKNEFRFVEYTKNNNI